MNYNYYGMSFNPLTWIIATKDAFLQGYEGNEWRLDFIKIIPN